MYINHIFLQTHIFRSDVATAPGGERGHRCPGVRGSRKAKRRSGEATKLGNSSVPWENDGTCAMNMDDL